MGLSQSDCDPKPTCYCGVPLSPLDVEANDGMCSDCREDERVRKILLQEYAN